MVDTGRTLFWRRTAAGIAGAIFILAAIFTSEFDLTRAYAVAAQPATQQNSPTSKSRKTPKKAHIKPKPPKPVPLDELPPVPIEVADSGQNPLENFFQGLAKLEPAQPVTPEAALGSQSPSPVTPPAANSETPGQAQTATGAQAPPTSPTQAETTPSEPAKSEPAPSGVVHIIHFGDSHVASDYWAGVLREKLQARFGDAGPGFVLPGRPWPTIRYVEARSLDGQGWRTDGLKYTERDGVVGLGGMSLESYREVSPASASASFTQFQVFAATAPGATCLHVQVDDADLPDLSSQVEHVVTAPAAPAPDDRVPEPSPKSLGGGAADPPSPLAPIAPVKKSRKRRKSKPPVPQGPPFTPWPAGQPLDLVELSNSNPVPVGAHNLSIRSSCGPQARVLGVELYNGSKGVVYDTDGVNGARLEDLEKPLPALRAALLKDSQPSLIIVSYGTNDIGMRGFSPSEYEEQVFQILTRLKQDAGDASILVTGPTDRGSPRKRTRTMLQAGQEALQPAVRKAALRAGCAYWDQQAAMGGPGSMARWVRAGLGQFDYVHFTGAGYQKLANMLYDQLMVEYEKSGGKSTPQAPAPVNP